MRWPTGERRRAAVLLVCMSAAFIAYAVVAVPRLTNNHLSDVEFTGWSATLAHRIVLGDRPYVDFVLPIPPGSFLLVALIQKLTGRVMLLHELYLNEVIHLSMGLMAYAMVVRFTSRRVAALVSACTLVTVVQLNKEIPYDHTALAFAWASVTFGARALASVAARARTRQWALCGLFAGLTMLFKQSTGVGVLLGWPTAFAYLFAVEQLGGEPARGRAMLRDGVVWGAAAFAGLVVNVAVLLAMGSTLGAYFQAVFIDGPSLKGGSAHLVYDLFSYVARFDAFPTTIVFAFVLAAIGARVVRFRGSLHIGDEPEREDPLGVRGAIAIGGALAGVFGIGIAVLLSHFRGIEPSVDVWFDRLKVLPMFGFTFACAFFASHLRRPGSVRDGADPLRVGHALNALMLAALIASLFHNTSAPEFRAFYDNNPIIPLVFLSLFAALERARLPRFQAVMFVLILASLYGNKLGRAMAAKIPVGRTGYWAGMYVNPRGRTIIEAALRARALAGPDETVLVLPEDLEIEGLIGRPRPPLEGAIVYVDQYPKRLVAHDRQVLAEHPPKVVVIQPRERLLWTNVFRIWSSDSGTERIIDFVQRQLLPRKYKLDSSYQTMFLGTPSHLDVYVRSDTPR